MYKDRPLDELSFLLTIAEVDSVVESVVSLPLRVPLCLYSLNKLKFGVGVLCPPVPYP